MGLPTSDLVTKPEQPGMKEKSMNKQDSEGPGSLLLQGNEVRDLRPELVTFGLQGSMQRWDHNHFKTQSPEFLVHSPKVPGTDTRLCDLQTRWVCCL